MEVQGPGGPTLDWAVWVWAHKLGRFGLWPTLDPGAALERDFYSGLVHPNLN